jgi:hypothetical protein
MSVDTYVSCEWNVELELGCDVGKGRISMFGSVILYLYKVSQMGCDNIVRFLRMANR